MIRFAKIHTDALGQLMFSTARFNSPLNKASVGGHQDPNSLEASGA